MHTSGARHQQEKSMFPAAVFEWNHLQQPDLQIIKEKEEKIHNQ